MRSLMFSIILMFTLSSGLVNAGLFDAEVEIDINNDDLNRIEGWIKTFPKDVREQLEKLFTNVIQSKEYNEERDLIFTKLSTVFECANDRLFDSLDKSVADTYLGKKKYSNYCIKEATGEKPSLFGGQSFNTIQRFELERCTLAEFTKRNKNKSNFLRHSL